jgi:glycyl-tRNA synthetase beta chain
MNGVSSRDFLVELGTEELPPLALQELEQAFAAGVRAGLSEAGIPHGELRSFATPRRLAVWVRDVAAVQPAQAIKLKGPPVSAAFDKAGKPTAAATKFAEKCGVGVEVLTRITEGKGEFLFFEGTKAGLTTVSMLPGIVQKSLDALPIPKRMRWGSSTAEFVRPVHWLVLLFGGDVIPASVLDTESGRATRGHRFMAPGELPLAKPADYELTLREQGKVIADFAARRALIREQVAAAAGTLTGEALLDDELLDEVTSLVEWPTAITGSFEGRFLELPREVLISTLQQHQRYFAVQNASGKLLPHFITVSNIESRDPSKVRAGNERVVRPRLSDGAFFWSQDRKQKLIDRRPGLDAVTFQANLGSMGEKADRVTVLAGQIALLIDADKASTTRGAQLAKCDLLTAMVGEFPELQGTMGRYYATADGEPAEVCAAIDEHYLPRGAGGALPGTGAGVAVALADKLDTLAGIFAIGQKPTGTKDPFGLRRAAIGLVRILVEKKIDLDLRSLVRSAAQQASQAMQRVPPAKPGATTAPVPQSVPDPVKVEAEVWEYIVERLRAYFVDAGATTEMFDAVRASEPVSPLDFGARLNALVKFLALPEAASLTAANKRIANILKKSTSVAPETPRQAAPPVEPRVDLLREPAEKALHEALAAAVPDVERALAKRDYAAALARLAKLRPAVDAFFDGVMVNADDAALRSNRLALLAQMRGLFTRIADLSCLPG